MKQSSLFGLVLVLLLALPVQAQSLSPGFSDLLAQQGFTVVSKRYTWLGRIVVEVSNGVYQREILLTRGSNQILQDNWSLIDPARSNGVSGQSASGGASAGSAGGAGGSSGQGNSGGQGGPGGSGNGAGARR